MKCPNCGSVMTCGCQRKQLPNGKVGCTKCINTSTASKTADAPTVNSAELKDK